jgi:hypothetical protein
MSVIAIQRGNTKRLIMAGDSSCHKIQYKTMAKAKKAVRVSSGIRNQIRAYKCYRCGHFHTSSGVEF